MKQTRVVEVSFTGPAPELDAKIANALVESFPAKMTDLRSKLTTYKKLDATLCSPDGQRRTTNSL